MDWGAGETCWVVQTGERILMYDYGCGIDGVWLGKGNAGLGTYEFIICMN